MKFLIYTKNETRKNLLLNLLSKVKAQSHFEFEFITEISDLCDTLTMQEYDVAAGIFDFDTVDYPTFDLFISKVANLHQKISVLTSSPYKLTELPNFLVKKVASFEEVLLEAANFTFKCESLPQYTYKLVIKEGKCYLQEYFGGKKTKNKQIHVENYKDGTLGLSSENIDALVVKRLLSPSSNLLNIFGSIKEITVYVNEKKLVFHPKHTVDEIETELETIKNS